MSGLTDTIPKLLNREALAILGDVFSIASFIVSLFVLLNVRRIKNLYRLRVRGPALVKQLAKSTTSLSNYMNEYREFMPQISEELGRVAAKLKSLEAKLSGHPKASVKRVRGYVDQCEVKAENERDVRKTYIEVLKVVEELKDHQKDLDWEH